MMMGMMHTYSYEYGPSAAAAMGLVQASQRKNGSHELRNGDKTWPFWYTFSAAATILRCNNHTARTRGPNATATAGIAQPLRHETAGFGYPCDGRDLRMMSSSASNE